MKHVLVLVLLALPFCLADFVDNKADYAQAVAGSYSSSKSDCSSWPGCKKVNCTINGNKTCTATYCNAANCGTHEF